MRLSPAPGHLPTRVGRGGIESDQPKLELVYRGSGEGWRAMGVRSHVKVMEQFGTGERGACPTLSMH